MKEGSRVQEINYKDFSNQS